MDLYDILLAKNLGGGGGGVTPTGTKSITSNGTYDVKSYASAHVSVPGIVPSGTYNITSNGMYNVTDYASASVSVTAPAVNIQALNVTENGTYTASGSVDGYSPVTVNVSGGGGTDSRFAQLIERTLVSASDSTATKIGGYAFYYNSVLQTASFPAVTSIGSNAFYYCRSLTTVSFPSVTSIGSNAFYNCDSLTTASFPAVTSIGSNAFCNCSRITTVNFLAVTRISSYAFSNCGSITTASFPAVTSIGGSVFRNCYHLVSLYLMGSSVPTLGAGVFYSTPIEGYSTQAGQYGSVYVPSSLWATYQTAANWSSIASRIVSM